MKPLAFPLLADGNIHQLPSELVVRGSLVDRNADVGVLSTGSKVTIESSVVRDTQPRSSDKMVGYGVFADVDHATKLPSELLVRGSLIERNTQLGISVSSSEATIEATVVRDTKPPPSGRFLSGFGLLAQMDRAAKAPSRLVVRGSLVDHNTGVGIAVSSSTAVIEATMVRDTQPASDNSGGVGIAAQPDPVTRLRSELTVRASVLQRNLSAGIYIVGGSGTIEITVVGDTQPRASDGKFGDGILVSAHASMRVVRSFIERSARAGVSVFGASLVLEGSVIRCSSYESPQDSSRCPLQHLSRARSELSERGRLSAADLPSTTRERFLRCRG